MYDYKAKYAPGGSEHLSRRHADRTRKPARRHSTSQAPGASSAWLPRGVSRADLRYDDTGGEPGRMVLAGRSTTQPGMTPTSARPSTSRATTGIDFVALVRWMVENAACDP